ncbi:MAG: hypothetical protein U0V87_16800 [Acidobacteriota bacterium]
MSARALVLERLSSLAVSVFALFGLVALTATFAGASELSLEQRVAAQTAIQNVYLAHQSAPEGAASSSISPSIAETRVLNALRQNAALARQWGVEVTDAMLNAELDRIARDTRMPDRLQELYDVLGNDPVLVIETLVRPQLVERLAHRAFAYDSGIHAMTRRQAEELRTRLLIGAIDADATSADRIAVRFVPRQSPSQHEEWRDGVRIVPLEQSEFDAKRSQWSRVPRMGDLLETEESFGTSVVLSNTETQLEIARFAVRKQTWDTWWLANAPRFNPNDVRTVRAIPAMLPAPARDARNNVPLTPANSASNSSAGSGNDAPTCTPDDIWNNRTLDDIPEGREGHSVIWTGVHMFLWGGAVSGTAQFDSGFRYDPATDTWLRMTNNGAPSARWQHLSAWTGLRILIWGGSDALGYRNDGFVYNPFDDTWSPMSSVNAPTARVGAAAAWVGNRFIVWGGFETATSTFVNTGAAYDPATNTWTALPTLNAPIGRAYHTAIGTGSLKKMVIWGGEGNDGLLATGGVYNVATGTWAQTANTGAPRARYIHTAVWTGQEMIVWGGYGVRRGEPMPELLDTGGRYSPTTSSWTGTTSMVGQPTSRGNHSAVWAGSRMIVWGGEDTTRQFGTGGVYDPSTNSWTSMTTSGAPLPRRDQTAVWTGQEMLIWGGYGVLPWGEPGYLSAGGRYKLATDSWLPINNGTAPEPRHTPFSAWTGNQLVIWGGERWLDYVQSGGRFDPVFGTWLPMSTANAPPIPRYGRSSVWSGSELLIWGGHWTEGGYNDGNRYNPITDTWSPITNIDAPEPRTGHVTLWTGSRMLIWGGDGSPYGLVTGGLYDPTTNSWSATNTVGAPRGRANPAAVWLGSEMFVWSGRDVGIYLTDGALYNPATGVWRSISENGVPEARQGAYAVWTGRYVLVFSGSTYTTWYIPTAARYEPAKDRWSPMAHNGGIDGYIGNAPVWTGTHLLAWGINNYEQKNRGRIYDPVDNNWIDITNVNAPPAPRTGASTAWANGQLLVWGGGPYFRDGGYWGVDTDADGAGDRCDCAPNDASVTGAPREIDELEFAADRATLNWTSGTFTAGTGTTHDILRGSASTLPVSTASSTCVATQLAAASVVDSSVPSAGSATWYLVRARNSCAVGSYGQDSSGGERLSNACP